MFAYRIPDLDPQGGHAALAAHPAGRRIAGVARWQLVAHPNGGSLATWLGHPFSPGSYGEGRPTHDGMTYFPPKEWPADRAALLRDKLPDHEAVELVNGRVLIGLALRAPRPRRFAGAPSLGKPSGDLADAAFALWDRLGAKEAIALDDPGLARVLFLAVAACYRVTEEALDDLGWLTTADDDAVTAVVFGLDPKSEPGAGGSSPSSPPGSPTATP